MPAIPARPVASSAMVAGSGVDVTAVTLTSSPSVTPSPLKLTKSVFTPEVGVIVCVDPKVKVLQPLETAGPAFSWYETNALSIEHMNWIANAPGLVKVIMYRYAYRLAPSPRVSFGNVAVGKAPIH